jgi:hypothetical protein
MDTKMPDARSRELLAPSDFKSPAGMMWMVLALTGLHEDALPHGDAFDNTEQAIMYNTAMGEAVRSFSPFYSNFTSTISPFHECERENAASMLFNTRHHYHRAANIPPDIAIMSQYLCTMFMDFYMQIINNPIRRPFDPFSAYGMETAVAGLMRELLQHIVKVIVYSTFRKTISNNRAIFQEEFKNHVCQALEDYIECKMNKLEFQGVVPCNIIGKSIIQLIQPLLHIHVEEAGSDFYDDVGFGTDHELIEDSLDMDITMDELYFRLGSFFGFHSSLLEDFWPEVEDYIPEHIANHDFEQYEDDDWYEREYQLHDGQDVLCGPEHVNMDGFSIPVEAAESLNLHCGLCDDTDARLRRLKICGHEFCEDCLKSQLEANHECRYKCALCRADFFPSISA